jgi:hypothetical protein
MSLAKKVANESYKEDDQGGSRIPIDTRKVSSIGLKMWWCPKS